MKFQLGYICHERAQYIYGQRPSDGVRGAEDLSSGEIEAFRLENPWVTTKSEKIMRHLAFISSFKP